jgi:hypothetical protein
MTQRAAGAQKKLHIALINDHSLGVCCWPPYRWQGESAILHVGINTVEIRITNTLNSMLEGSYFDDASHQIVPITGK